MMDRMTIRFMLLEPAPFQLVWNPTADPTMLEEVAGARRTRTRRGWPSLMTGPLYCTACLQTSSRISRRSSAQFSEGAKSTTRRTGMRGTGKRDTITITKTAEKRAKAIFRSSHLPLRACSPIGPTRSARGQFGTSSRILGTSRLHPLHSLRGGLGRRSSCTRRSAPPRLCRPMTTPTATKRTRMRTLLVRVPRQSRRARWEPKLSKNSRTTSAACSRSSLRSVPLSPSSVTVPSMRPRLGWRWYTTSSRLPSLPACLLTDSPGFWRRARCSWPTMTRRRRMRSMTRALSTTHQRCSSLHSSTAMMMMRRMRMRRKLTTPSPAFLQS
mmetsp:Transcript_8550/g.19977  ORF Transcript_8550/g.19977 Transcript_8550/m.19977 type:complete len:327 (-) Transcript_8550:3389-4369(-)